MNYLLFLTAFFSFASAVYKVKEDSTYIFNYEAKIESKPGKVCTGFAKMVFDFNNGEKTFYGKEIHPNKPVFHEFTWKSPVGVTELTITPTYKFKPEGSDIFTSSSDNCNVIYENQDIRIQTANDLNDLFPKKCDAYDKNPDTLPYLIKRVRRCAGGGAVGIALGTALASVWTGGGAVFTLPVTLAANTAACVFTACANGLVGADCVKLGGSCDPDGLRCCKSKSGRERTCAANFRGRFKCEN